MVTMIEYLAVLASGFLGVFMGALASLYIIKRAINNGFFEEILENALSDEQIIQKVYILSGIIGQGFANGSGLKNVTKKGGKLRLEDIIIQMGLGYLGKAIPQNPVQNQEPDLPSVLNRRLTT